MLNLLNWLVYIFGGFVFVMIAARSLVSFFDIEVKTNKNDKIFFIVFSITLIIVWVWFCVNIIAKVGAVTVYLPRIIVG